MTYYTETAIKTGSSGKISLLDFLLRADRQYRERQHMLSLSDELLKDVGLTRTNLQKL